MRLGRWTLLGAFSMELLGCGVAGQSSGAPDAGAAVSANLPPPPPPTASASDASAPAGTASHPSVSPTATGAAPKPINWDEPYNSLPAEAITPDNFNQYRRFIASLPTMQLTSLTPGNADVVAALPSMSDPSVRANFNALMKYIVSCALDPRDVVNPGTVNLSRDVNLTRWNPPWNGELGLCGVGAPAGVGNWGAGPVPPDSTACTELVSSCVIARLNANHLRVPISVRGDPKYLFMPLRPTVKVEKHYREDFGDKTIESFEECSISPPVAARLKREGPERNCGWAPAMVGRCTAKKPVTLYIPSPGAAQPMSRICSGIHGCNSGDRPTPLQSSYMGCISYSAGDKCTSSFVGSTVNFTCPFQGYYSVMLATKGSLTAPADVAVNPVNLPENLYPAPEEKVFAIREGAFFGNVFDPTVPALNDRDLTRNAVLYNEMYSCSDPDWSNGLAYLTGRLCATSVASAVCLLNPPRHCVAARESPSASARCQAPNPWNWGFESCNGSDAEPYWPEPITVYLNAPCDLSRSRPDCERPPPQ